MKKDSSLLVDFKRSLVALVLISIAPLATIVYKNVVRRIKDTLATNKLLKAEDIV